MSSDLALAVWVVLLLALLVFDPSREPKTSWALWIPIAWLFFEGSRLPSRWLNFSMTTSRMDALMSGNPLDRVVWFSLMLLALLVLFSRSFQWGNFFARNLALTAFLACALLSVIWSDFPLITFKRWFRDLGEYLTILVVLTDPYPLEAVRTVFRRLAYLLIPMSVVFVKYFPHLGRGYDPWSGGVEYTGVTTSKNMLGVLCLVSGLFFFWDTLSRWAERKEPRTRRILLLNFSFFAMSLWMLHYAQSATSTVCLVIGCLLLIAIHSQRGRRHVRFLKVMAPASFILYVVLAMGLGMSGEMNRMVGRQANFTDRTQIWHVLLKAPINPLLGTGYQSFWLGWRIPWAWRQFGGDNVLEAHNGYLSMDLELGLVGVFLVLLFLISCYRKIMKCIEPFTLLGSLAFALWTVLLFYNVTEAAFEGGLLWMAILVVCVEVPGRPWSGGHELVPLDARALEQPQNIEWQPKLKNCALPGAFRP